ncbi:MAG: PAS domain-containing protein, partial [Euryarchaeota archaeon]|nr:PAS domain-containing protein [Euryarchaeota archaeon]
MIPDMSRASHDELIAEIEDLKKQLDVIHASEQEFLNAVQHALDQREAGEHARLNPGSYSDGLKDLAFAVNNALEQGEKQEEKARFYRNILESLPVPISVTDLNEKWTYINENLESMSNLHREDVLGMNCSGWGTNICNTEQCAIKALKRGETESVFEHGRGHYKTLASYLQDPDGNAIGHVVVIVDIADMVWITDYT